jgi:hypothetical protein
MFEFSFIFFLHLGPFIVSYQGPRILETALLPPLEHQAEEVRTRRFPVGDVEDDANSDGG